MFRYRNAKKFSLVSMYDSSVGWTNDSLKILDDDWMAHRMVSLREDVSDEEVYALIDMIIIKYLWLFDFKLFSRFALIKSNASVKGSLLVR